MSEETAYMFSTWLSDRVNIRVPEGLIRSILVERDVDEKALYTEVEERVRDLCKADLYSCIALTSPNRAGAVSDEDNGWSHSDGGFTLSEYDKKLLLDAANEIYEEYEEPTKGRRTKIKIINFGIKRTKIPL